MLLKSCTGYAALIMLKRAHSQRNGFILLTCINVQNDKGST
jgi:hypothetical protein